MARPRWPSTPPGSVSTAAPCFAPGHRAVRPPADHRGIVRREERPGHRGDRHDGCDHVQPRHDDPLGTSRGRVTRGRDLLQSSRGCHHECRQRAVRPRLGVRYQDGVLAEQQHRAAHDQCQPECREHARDECPRRPTSDTGIRTGGHHAAYGGRALRTAGSRAAGAGDADDWDGAQYLSNAVVLATPLDR
jgi:hypothetical protein